MKKLRNEAIEMVRSSQVATHTGIQGYEEFDSKLADEINNIEKHFKNIVNLLHQKKDRMVQDLKSSVISTGKSGKLTF